MPVTTDIVASWRRPRTVMRRFLDQGQREDRALIFLMTACFLLFIAQLPRLSRIVAGFEELPGGETPEFTALVAYAFFGSMFVLPLVFYGLAGLSHLVARPLGGQGSWFGARLALFWALLASTPAALLYGLVRGFIGVGIQAALVGFIWTIAFVVIWLFCLTEAEAAR
ncbi:YIP1 family protein [Pelagovum pacificum]|uniref:Yip1 domain-containing protein n=1 Tax=Pelagovum pacificum TaxID=2588711 RepID=A0A5C5GDV0_9RHOB|nr:YIP1 family protein [Pelagovum pacificum]QQA44694.1 YIP1 family protein [Pelagovum pacificum]TNY32197.1 hypothetical protein FHY64_02555 [Pelagovum pacificum]